MSIAIDSRGAVTAEAMGTSVNQLVRKYLQFDRGDHIGRNLDFPLREFRSQPELSRRRCARAVQIQRR